jgi:TRAP-type C4-dicarboxylate transport system substrate-binding protein
MYLGMQRGVVDGIVFPLGAARSFKLEEVTKYVLKLDFFSYHLMEAMNLRTWRRLPPAQQEVVMRVADNVGYLSGFHYENTDAFTVPYFKAKGVEIIELEPAVKQQFIDKVAGLKGKMIDELEEKGEPGKETMARIDALIAKYRATVGSAKFTY